MSDPKVVLSNYLTIRFDQLEDGKVRYHPMPDYQVLLPYRDGKELMQLAEEGEPLSVLGMYAMTLACRKFIIECLDIARTAQAISLEQNETTQIDIADQQTADTTNFH